MQRNARNILCWTAFALLGVGGGLALAGDRLKGLPPNPSPADVLNHLLKLSPAERMLVLDKVPAQDRMLMPVTRGPLVQTILERGTLQAIQSTTVYCTIKPNVKSATIATTIRWIVDDGAWVKKGDKLIEFRRFRPGRSPQAAESPGHPVCK